MSYREIISADRRLVILRLLLEADGYEANSSVLQIALASFGHNMSRDLVHTELSWLAEQGVVTIHDVSSVKVATLTRRGMDIAEGRSSVPGIKKPGPK